MSGLAVHVEGPQPRPRTIPFARHVHNRPQVQRSRIPHFAIVLREPLRLSPTWRNAPKIHFAGVGKALHKINPLAVPGPDWKMIVFTRFAYEYLTRPGAGTVRYKHRVTRVRGVIHEAIPVGRPRHIPWRRLA